MSVKPEFFSNTNKYSRFKAIPDELKNKIEGEIKALLHSSRDCLRNKGVDTTKSFLSANDGYYGEAFGILRGLNILGYGWFGCNNLDGTQETPSAKQPENNLSWWFAKLQDEVTEEENFTDDHRCEYCLSRYGKDTKSLIEQEKI